MIRAAAQFGVVACVSAAVLAGCSDPPAHEAVKPVSGGTFVEAIVRPASLDPALAATVGERVIADQLYDGLTTWDPNDQTAEAALAQTWEPSPDRKQWTFHLRDAVAGNNERIVAGDVKSTLQRIARKNLSSPSADFLALIAGFKDFSTNDAVADLTGVVVIDERTIRIDLSEPFGELPKLLGNPTFGIVHHSADGAAQSTGPMTVDSAADPNTLRLKKAPGSKTYVDRVDVRYYQDIASAYSAFVKGEVQWAPVPTDKVEEAAQKYDRHLFRPSLRTLFLAINVENPKFADVKFREAIVHAINRGAVETKLNIGDAEVLNGVVPQGVPGAQNGGCGERCKVDQNIARDLLKQAFPTGPPPAITLDVSTGAPLVDPALKEIVDDLAQVGITANVRPTPPDQYGARTAAPDRELFQTSWSAAYPSPDAFLTPLFLSTSVSNVSSLKDAKVDAALVNAQKARDAYSREQQFQDAERRVMDQSPIVPIAQFPVASVAVADVRGIDPQLTGNFNIADVWLTNPPR